MNIVVALEGAGDLGLVDYAADLACRRHLPLEIIGARVRPAPLVHFAPVDVSVLRKEIAAEADAILLQAIERVPKNVALTARLVDGKAWNEVQRLAKLHPGELLAVREERQRGRRRRAASAARRTCVIHL